MIKITFGDIAVEVETPQQAAELIRLIRGNSRNITVPLTGVTATSQTSLPNIGIKDSALINSLSKISSLHKETVSSKELCDILDIGGLQGLGPRIKGLSKRFEAIYAMPFERVLQREERPGQESVWHVDKDTLKSIGFIQ